MGQRESGTSKDKHVIYCSHTGHKILQTGTDAERLTVNYLLENLSINRVGNYRILVNYNLPFRSAGGSGTLEIDLVVINKFGVFAVEVKDWRGAIEAQDGFWMQDQKYKRNDVFGQIEHKSRILHSKLFGSDSILGNLSKVSVTPLIVLFRGKRFFTNRSRYDAAKVVGVDNDLILALSSERLLFHGRDSRFLNDDEIKQISDLLFAAGGQGKDEVIGHYQILGELSSGDLFLAYEGVHVDFPDKKVRIKAYNLSELPSRSMEQAMRLIKQGTQAVWQLDPHPNILQIREFFSSPNRADVFYEVTEPINGERLDEFLLRFSEPIPINVQLECLKQLCSALDYAHSQGVFHRNLCPETVFIIRNDRIKLADFDFAKIVGKETISRPGEVLVDSQYTAPELFFNPSSAKPASDIYSLGVLWFVLASHPSSKSFLGAKDIDLLQLPENAKVVMKKMTDKAPANRPQSIEKVSKLLKELGEKGE